MNNLFEKDARWILGIIAILVIVAIGVWFLPWFIVAKLTISGIFGILAGFILFISLNITGPQ